MTAKRTATLLGLALAALLAGGCAAVGNYVDARVGDLRDIAPVNFASGRGLSADVRVTPLVGVGAGWSDTWRFGTDEQRFGPLWRETFVGIPLVTDHRVMVYPPLPERFPGSDTDEEVRIRTVSHLVVPGGAQSESPFPPPLGDSEWMFPKRSPWEWLNIEAGVVAGFIGARVTLSPLELVDFTLGIFTLDPAGDDPAL